MKNQVKHLSYEYFSDPLTIGRLKAKVREAL